MKHLRSGQVSEVTVDNIKGIWHETPVIRTGI